MKKTICFVCALLCVLTLASCGASENSESAPMTDTTGFYMGEPIDITDDIKETVLSFRNAYAWRVTSSSTMQYVENNDEESTGGYMVGFDGSMIKDENGVNMYHGDTYAMNSAFSFAFEFEKYFYDGWVYQIYHDSTYEEANSYQRYEYSEQDFLYDYNGIIPTFVSDAEFESAEVYENEDSIVVCVTPDPEGRALEEMLGSDLELVANNNGISEEEIRVSGAAITYGIKDGCLVSYICSYTLQFYAGGNYYEYTMEKMCNILAVDDEVERFTLPENRDEYELLTYGD